MLFDRIRQGFFALILVVAVVLGDDWLRTAAWALFAIVALAYLLTLYLTRDSAYAKPSPRTAAERPRTLAETVAANLPDKPTPDGKGFLYPAICHDGDRSVEYLFFCDDAEREGFLLVRDYDHNCRRRDIIDALERESGVMIRRGWEPQNHPGRSKQ